tara:strand:- start:365 stop:505 length:141 start_codon:yes stop_codon:yes gene_type:complete
MTSSGGGNDITQTYCRSLDEPKSVMPGPLSRPGTTQDLISNEIKII